MTKSGAVRKGGEQSVCARPPVCGACKAESDTECEVMKCRRMFVRCSRDRLPDVTSVTGTVR